MFLSVDIIYLKITKKEDSKKSEMGYTRRKTKEKKGASEQLYKVSGKSPCPSFLKSVLPAKAWRAILSFRLKKKQKLFTFKFLTLLFSAHLFSVSSGLWQTLNCFWKVFGTTSPESGKDISNALQFQVPIVYCWLARILVQAFWRAIWQCTSKSSRIVHPIWSSKLPSRKLT